MQSGQDQAMGRIFKRMNAREADPIRLGFAPYYVYRWDTVKTWHISSKRGDEGYRTFSEKVGPIAAIERLQPNVPEPYERLKVTQ